MLLTFLVLKDDFLSILEDNLKIFFLWSSPKSPAPFYVITTKPDFSDCKLFVSSSTTTTQLFNMHNHIRQLFTICLLLNTVFSNANIEGKKKKKKKSTCLWWNLLSNEEYNRSKMHHILGMINANFLKRKMGQRKDRDEVLFYIW